VLLPPSVAADLARSLGALLAAENVLQNLRPLLSHLDQPIASPAVTLVDDGALADGLKSQPIDDEGTATTATTLIERGRLRALLHTLQSADQLGVAPNGKAMRLALWKQPRSVPSNIYVQGGDATPEQLRGQLRRGLAVMSTPRPGRIHPATGKFTVVAQGWWVEDGELVRPVHGVPLSANIFDLLRNVTACGTDLHFSPLADGAGAPSVLIERMQVG
jgi:PmbA protein